MKPVATASLRVLGVCTALLLALPARAEIVVLSGVMDAAQVVAPVLDAAGNVIGSSHFNPDGTPASNSTATGFATVTIDTVALTVRTQASWTGMTGPADRAHLHDAPFGVTRLLSPPNDRFFHEVINFDGNWDNYPIVTVTGSSLVGGAAGVVDCVTGLNHADGIYDLTNSDLCGAATGALDETLLLDDSRFDPTGQFAFTDFNALLTAFETSGLFLDFHTAALPGGEIRGQLRWVHTVPEPTALALVLVGLLGGVSASRRRLLRR
jgi:hypothetical protein